MSDTDEFGETYHYHLTYDSPNLPACRVGASAVGTLSSPDNADVALPGGGGGGPGGAGPPGRGRAHDRGPADHDCTAPERGWLAPVVALGVIALDRPRRRDPASAHDATDGSTVVEIDDRRVVVTASVPFAELGYVDTSGDGLIDADELAEQEADGRAETRGDRARPRPASPSTARRSRSSVPACRRRARSARDDPVPRHM